VRAVWIFRLSRWGGSADWIALLPKARPDTRIRRMTAQQA